MFISIQLVMILYSLHAVLLSNCSYQYFPNTSMNQTDAISFIAILSWADTGMDKVSLFLTNPIDRLISHWLIDNGG